MTPAESKSPDHLRGPKNIRLPIHGAKASILFREPGTDGYRIATTGSGFSPGKRIEIRPGLRLTIRYCLGGTDPLPGDPPREQEWLATTDSRLQDESDSVASLAARYRRVMRKIGLTPVRRRHRRSEIPG